VSKLRLGPGSGVVTGRRHISSVTAAHVEKRMGPPWFL
jgi:hypothetical protein